MSAEPRGREVGSCERLSVCVGTSVEGGSVANSVGCAGGAYVSRRDVQSGKRCLRAAVTRCFAGDLTSALSLGALINLCLSRNDFLVRLNKSSSARCRCPALAARRTPPPSPLQLRKEH